jgi:hypothetical protein
MRFPTVAMTWSTHASTVVNSRGVYDARVG